MRSNTNFLSVYNKVKFTERSNEQNFIIITVNQGNQLYPQKRPFLKYALLNSK